MNYILARPWLAQAHEDLQTAQSLFDLGRYGPCAFFCQQAAEKARKAILYYHNQRPWGHQLLELVNSVEAALGTPLSETWRHAATSLDAHYTTPRYPDAHATADPSGDYDADVAGEALDDAKAFLALAEREVQP